MHQRHRKRDARTARISIFIQRKQKNATCKTQKAMREVLKVLLWGQEIGRLAWHDVRKTSFFTFNPEFLKGSLDVAPLTASIHNPLSTRAIFGETERIYQKLPSFIADSLPDAWGNLMFEQWRIKNRLTERNITPLEKLAFIGKRGMGALEFEPEIERGAASGKIDIKAAGNVNITGATINLN